MKKSIAVIALIIGGVYFISGHELSTPEPEIIDKKTMSREEYIVKYGIPSPHKVLPAKVSKPRISNEAWSRLNHERKRLGCGFLSNDSLDPKFYSYDEIKRYDRRINIACHNLKIMMNN